MKFCNFILIAFTAFTLASTIPQGFQHAQGNGILVVTGKRYQNDTIEVGNTPQNETIESDVEVNAMGFGFIKKGKKAAKSVKVLKGCLKHINKIKAIKSKNFKIGKKIIHKGKKFLGSDKKEIVENLVVKVFTALKESGLINAIIKMSLTDDEVRPAIADITVELISADVIPYEEIFDALKSSGLAVDVLKNLITDSETRTGTIELVRDLVVDLIKDGILTCYDFNPPYTNMNYNKTVTPVVEQNSE